MARGPKKHLKRLNAPKHWMLSKMDGIWVSGNYDEKGLRCAHPQGTF